MAKYKATGCARFFVVLLILAPLAYLGASWYLGQDGVGNIKKLLGIGQENSTSDDEVYQPTSADFEKQLSGKDKEIDALKKENADLKSRIDDLEAEVEQLKSNGDVNH